MTRFPNHLIDPLVPLIEDYLNGSLDEAGTVALEHRLTTDPTARDQFVRYARMHTDLTLELRARRAADLAIGALHPPVVPARAVRPRRLVAVLAVVAGLLLAVGFGRKLSHPADEAVAWLVNAQNCSWTDGEPPGDLRPGKSIRIDGGLAEVQFRCGARLIVEGPARLELVSATSTRLVHGKIAARVPTEAIGFEVLCPQGKVIDLGTEFGVAVSPTGAADVYVFEGRVEAYPSGGQAKEKVDLVRHQGARLEAGAVTRNPDTATRFVRQIVPAPVTVPRKRVLLFNGLDGESIRDATGVGTGFTHRLPGTGDGIGPNDENLRLLPATNQLELTTTNSDLNTQYRLRRGEYLGVRLSDQGFTGREDFEVTATFPAIPALDGIGQFGLYAGSRSDLNIRGGVLISDPFEGQYTQFLVNNPDGKDTDTKRVGLSSAGTNLRMVLRRTDGKYTMTVDNQTVGFANTLSIQHPDLLDAETDLYVGLFGANTQSAIRRPLLIKDFQVTVWKPVPGATTVPPTRQSP